MISELQETEINVTVSLQEKGGFYHAVLSYKDFEGRWCTKWKTTKIKAKSGNKKLAKQRANTIKDDFKLSLQNTINKEIEKPKRTGIESQLDMEFIDFLIMRLEEVNVKRKYEYTTYKDYKGNIYNHMKDFFGSSKIKRKTRKLNSYNPAYKSSHIYKVEEIDSDLIDSFFTYLSTDCNLKNTSIRHYKDQINIAFSVLDKKEIKVNPIKGIEPLTQEVYISQTYTMKEINRLFEVVKDDVIELPVLLATYYGLRRSEVVGLRWSAINFEDNTISINHTVIQVSGNVASNLDKKLIARDKTKTIQSNRTLPLYPEIKEALLEKKKRISLNQQLYKSYYNNNYLDYVCVKDNGELINPDTITHRFQKILKRNNLKKIRFHDLRHTIATELNANGVDIKAIAEFLGHSNLSTTKRYAHPDPRIKQYVAQTYENLINQAKNVSNNNTPPIKHTKKRFTVKRKIYYITS